MRKLLFLFLAVFSFASSQAAQEQVELHPHGSNTSGTGNSHPRTPIQAPTVYLDGHTLSFLYAFSEDIEVQLLDPDTLDDDEPTVVYSTAMYAGAQTVNLPTTYTGDYVLRLVVGSWYFIGEITL